MDDVGQITIGRMEFYWLAVVAVVVVGVLFALRPYHGRPWLRAVAMVTGSIACLLTAPASWLLAPTWGAKIVVGAAIGAVAPYAWNAVKRRIEKKYGERLAPTINLDPSLSFRQKLTDAAAERDKPPEGPC